jgi:hypothetical protein
MQEDAPLSAQAENSTVSDLQQGSYLADDTPAFANNALNTGRQGI